MIDHVHVVRSCILVVSWREAKVKTKGKWRKSGRKNNIQVKNKSDPVEKNNTDSWKTFLLLIWWRGIFHWKQIKVLKPNNYAYLL